MQNLHIAGSDKPVKFYNLDVIISVGYRVKSGRGTQFRIWATHTLRDHLAPDEMTALCSTRGRPAAARCWRSWNRHKPAGFRHISGRFGKGYCGVGVYFPAEVGAMSKVERIEQEIERLSRSEFAELRDWILERDWQSWDAQVEQDARTGKLDELIGESQEDYRADRAREL